MAARDRVNNQQPHNSKQRLLAHVPPVNANEVEEVEIGKIGEKLARNCFAGTEAES
jgi:hypothetical protein